jgi:hypothetical protein
LRTTQKSYYQDNINSVIDVKYDYGGTKVKDKLMKIGITVSHNNSQYDELRHRYVMSENNFEQSITDIEFSFAKKNCSMLKVKARVGKSRLAFLTAITVGAVGGYFHHDSLCKYRNEVDARVERLRNK